MLPGDQHKKNENDRVVAQWASLFRTCREIKSINAVTPRLLVIHDILRFINLKGESELDGSLELTWGSGGGGLFVVGGSIPSCCAPSGGFICPEGDKPSLVNPNSCKLPTRG